MTEHLGNPIPSPALFKQRGERFRHAVRSFAESNDLPVLQLNTPDRSRWNDRKVDHVRREYIDTATQPGVVAIVVAREVQKVFMGYTRKCTTGSPQFGFDKADRRVTVYYFSILDPAFGLGFIKIARPADTGSEGTPGDWPDPVTPGAERPPSRLVYERAA